jgi:uncharacterized protein (DUF1330 family)
VRWRRLRSPATAAATSCAAGAPQTAEGGPAAKHLVIVQFPDMAGAREWYHSAEYAPALALRQTALQRRLVFVQGV